MVRSIQQVAPGAVILLTIVALVVLLTNGQTLTNVSAAHIGVFALCCSSFYAVRFLQPTNNNEDAGVVFSVGPYIMMCCILTGISLIGMLLSMKYGLCRSVLFADVLLVCVALLSGLMLNQSKSFIEEVGASDTAQPANPRTIWDD